jgi:leucyl-tRNA synthetase
MLQVNGKLRGGDLFDLCLGSLGRHANRAAQEEVARFLEGRAPKRVIVVPGKLVNVVG